MENIKQIFDEIQATTSKTEKENILRRHAENETLQSTLRFLLNPYITTGLSTKKINKKLETRATLELSDGLAAMDYLQINNTGTDVVVANIQSFIRRSPPELAQFYTELFTKSLKLGCAANTVNRVFGKRFIPQFECMLAEKYFDHADKVEGKNFSLTLKLDGVRALAIKDEYGVQIFSRQGQRIDGLDEIEDEIANKTSGYNFVLDGELLIANVDGLSSKEQYKETIKIVRKDGKKSGIVFMAFDIVGLTAFMCQNPKMLYTERREILRSTITGLKHVHMLPTLYSGSDTTQITKWLEVVRGDNQEGLMLNINDGLYEFKRTRNLLKIKVMENCDLRIVDMEEGQGRLSGTLGRLNVEYKGNTVGVGSGFSDSQRKWFWENREALVGRVVSVNYFEETQDKDGKLSLRFPVFKELREEGKDVSYE